MQRRAQRGNFGGRLPTQRRIDFLEQHSIRRQQPAGRALMPRGRTGR